VARAYHGPNDERAELPRLASAIPSPVGEALAAGAGRNHDSLLGRYHRPHDSSSLADPQLLSVWGIARQWKPALLPVQQELVALNTTTGFTTFQSTLEATIHDDVHNAVGGDLATAASPKDPLFWLHHANIDRLWAGWQAQHRTAVPPNKNEVLQPAPLFGVKVATVLDIAALGYQYA